VQNGGRHGPYLYCYYYENGKRKSEYIPLAQAAKWGLERPQGADKVSEADAELGPSMIRLMGDKDEIRKEIRRLRRRARDQVREYERIGVRVPDNHRRLSEAYSLARRMPGPNGSGIWTDRGFSFAKSTALIIGVCGESTVRGTRLSGWLCGPREL
jgi:hypothetical protein